MLTKGESIYVATNLLQKPSEMGESTSRRPIYVRSRRVLLVRCIQIPHVACRAINPSERMG